MTVWVRGCKIRMAVPILLGWAGAWTNEQALFWCYWVGGIGICFACFVFGLNGFPGLRGQALSFSPVSWSPLGFLTHRALGGLYWIFLPPPHHFLSSSLSPHPVAWDDGDDCEGWGHGAHSRSHQQFLRDRRSLPLHRAGALATVFLPAPTSLPQDAVVSWRQLGRVAGSRGKRHPLQLWASYSPLSTLYNPLPQQEGPCWAAASSGEPLPEVWGPSDGRDLWGPKEGMQKSVALGASRNCSCLALSFKPWVINCL